MQNEIEKILKEQSVLNERIGNIVKSLNSEYSSAVSDELEKLYSNDAELEQRNEMLVSAVKSLESVAEKLAQDVEILSKKIKYVEENDERMLMQIRMMEQRLSASEKITDRNEMEEAVRKIRRD